MHLKHIIYLYTKHVGTPGKLMSTKTNDRVVI